MVSEKEPSRIDTLTALATEYALTKNLAAREELARLAQPRVKKFAEIIYRKRHFPREVILDDIISDANLGLLNAIEGYHPCRGAKFFTYAQHRIKGSILECLRERDFLSRHNRARADLMRDFEQRFRNGEQRNPAYEDYKNEWIRLKLPEERFDCFYRNILNVNNLSINDLEGKDCQRERGHFEYLEDEGQDPVEEVLAREAIEIFEDEISHLSQTKIRVLRSYLIDETTLEEAGASAGVSESRACQIIREQKNFLRAREYLETSC